MYIIPNQDIPPMLKADVRAKVLREYGRQLIEQGLAQEATEEETAIPKPAKKKAKQKSKSNDPQYSKTK